ncbi:FRG domain-containing protein [uncultured Brachyspira sp.]|uniref:FRG domain-containing protein n=1 Tax=uncultured Brachyspira sp. TaxID=221953 RepID=UPI00262A6DBD|nr:FRG domain-containing protein [uncultured Brachyspira sp.]
MSEIVEVTNIKEYVEAIIMDNENNSNEYYYRGEPRFYYKLLPSLARNTHILSESKLINEAVKLYPHVFKNILTPIELLITLQHYGIPTRLLDITSNAFVALFFACSNPINEKNEEYQEELDGKVYIFHNLNKTPYDGLENILARTYQLPDEVVDLEKYTEFIKFYSEYKVLQASMNFEIIENINNIAFNDDYIKSEENKKIINAFNDISYNPILINPPMLFDRIRLQAGNFMLFFNFINKDANNTYSLIESQINKLDENHKYIKKIIKVKDSKKMEILKQLKLFNISEKTLFYDNVDKNCEIIKRSICGE